MQDTTRANDSAKLSEVALINELKRLRTQIPDNPSLNPILNVAFDLSRRLESGTVSFDEIKALSERLMDRACVRRARRLREKVGYVDQATTLKDFTSYIEKTAKEAGSIEKYA
jgi:phosphoenolpyruvate carboxylase